MSKMTYLWVRCFDDDACWRVMPLCCVFAAYYSMYLPLLMLVYFDVKVLENYVGDLLVYVELWRSFFILGVLVLKMVANCVVSFVG